ncbi:MAG: hypothetical protein ACTSRS_16845 [Candidatus Helarchaeota archaeon]
MANKLKDTPSKNGLDTTTLIATVLIIVISIFSMISIFFLDSVQNSIEENQKLADDYYSILSVIDGDIDNIMAHDSRLQQSALQFQQEFLSLNNTIGQMRSYNLTHPGTYSQTDIDEIAIQAVFYIKQVNSLINQTYALDWAELSGMTAENNYTFYDFFTMEPIPYFLIRDNLKTINQSLDPSIWYWMQTIYGASNTTELLEINMPNWNALMYNDTSIVQEYGKYTTSHAANKDIEISGTSYYSLLGISKQYQAIADEYSKAAETMTTSMILMMTAAVIIAFAVSIIGRKYIWFSLIIGAIVIGIGIFLFGLAYSYSLQALVMEVWW